MPSNLAIDDRLLEEAQKIGGHRTEKATVNEALQEHIQRRRQARVLKLFGTIGFAGIRLQEAARPQVNALVTLPYGRSHFGALETLAGSSSTNSAS